MVVKHRITSYDFTILHHTNGVMGFVAAYCTADMRTCASFDKLAPWLVEVSEPLDSTTLRLSERLVTAPLMILRRSTLHDYMSVPDTHV